MNRDLSSAKALQAVGNANIEKFLREFGGERIYITSNATTDMERIRRVMGETVAAQLVEYCAGRRVYVPKFRPASITPAELLAEEPDAPCWRVIAVCRVSRTTYFRTRKDLHHGHNTD